MIAFHGSRELKDFVLNRIHSHEQADRIVRGYYWSPDQNGEYRGCAVGCTLHNAKQTKMPDLHDQYEHQLGIPRWIASLEDDVFENMSLENSYSWPRRFIEAIPVGSTFDNLERRLKARRLREELLNNEVIKDISSEDVYDEVNNYILMAVEALESGTEEEIRRVERTISEGFRPLRAYYIVESIRSALVGSTEESLWDTSTSSLELSHIEDNEELFDREANRILQEL